MNTERSRASAYARLAAVVSLVVVALALAGGGSSGVANAQAPAGLEGQKHRLLPLFETAGVVFTDADETNGRLVVGVLDRDVEGLIRARLATVGVSNQSVDIVEAPAIFAVATLRDQVRPVVGGLQIRFSQFLCTLGFNATLDGVPGFVTASHCSDRQGTVDGTKYYQPLDRVAEQFIGTEVEDPPYVRGPDCPRGRKCRYSDANFSEGASGVSFALATIARTTGANNGSLEISGDFTVTGDGTATVGQTANKVGRTTGWTRGSVTRTCVDTAVTGSNIVLLCQDFVEAGRRQPPIVGAGDSGSPVFRITSGDNVTLLGGLWGSSASGSQFVYSRIEYIEQELGGTLITH